MEFEPRVTPTMNDILQSLYTMEEIKALGPDGMCPLLFQTYWHIVGPTISKVVIGVLNGEGNCKTQILESVLTIIISQNYKLK